MALIQELFADTDRAAVIVSCISAAISAIAVLVTIIYNIISQKQHKKDSEPQLSMRLLEFEHILYLLVENTGKTAAKDIQITVIEIRGNGDSSKLLKSGLFITTFELYPNETVQGEVAKWGENMAVHTFPQIDIAVQYRQVGRKKCVKYRRSVSFTIAYDNKVSADINFDKGNIENTLKSINRATVRMANYFDGCHVASFDELEILAENSLKNDICDAIGAQEKKGPVLNRSEVIQAECKRRQKKK